ncbi:alpha/beta-hydrolase [Stipitochalara longipes BDJ]|nr:alpha/beta-hydrolase [Stipitochalara longipes BDJ]
MSSLGVILAIISPISYVTAAPTKGSANTSFPIVDLGTSLIRATLNSSGPHPYFNFSNIRYAQPPIGNLRFAAPLAPTVRNPTINDGQKGVICPQANPGWFADSKIWLATQNISALPTAPFNVSDIPTPDPRTSEDCLFLDVVVPESIFTKKSSPAPVLVWLYGGGYVSGDKTSSGSPATLISRSFDNGNKGLVFVAINYRLGMFGWLSGDSSVTSNAGLLDQKLAFEWVQQNIHLFGGDPDRVTVMGESAGGGSIMHHITAYSDGEKAPFHQAILQSPAFQPTLPSQEKEIFEMVLANASTISNTSIASLQDLKNLSSDTLQEINALIVGTSPYGGFTFGPVIDSTYVRSLPGVSLLEGHFDSSVKVMVGHNSEEGELFTSPFIQTQEEYVAAIQQIFPTASEAVISYVTETLYPPTFDGSYGYLNQIERTALTVSDITITCNTRYLDVAFKNETYSYIFSVPNGLHGEDVAYTFFNGDISTGDEGPPVIATLAGIFQDYLTGFAVKGTPNANGLPWFPMYGENETVKNVEYSDLNVVEVDPMANARCAYWQSAAYA